MLFCYTELSYQEGKKMKNEDKNENMVEDKEHNEEKRDEEVLEDGTSHPSSIPDSTKEGFNSRLEQIFRCIKVLKQVRWRDRNLELEWDPFYTIVKTNSEDENLVGGNRDFRVEAQTYLQFRIYHNPSGPITSKFFIISPGAFTIHKTPYYNDDEYLDYKDPRKLKSFNEVKKEILNEGGYYNENDEDKTLKGNWAFPVKYPFPDSYFISISSEKEKK